MANPPLLACNAAIPAAAAQGESMVYLKNIGTIERSLRVGLGLVAVVGALAVYGFTPPAYNGLSPILGYAATCGSQSLGSTTSPITVTGLVNGTPVNCVVMVATSGFFTPRIVMH